ncbi:MAG: autotransporter outer membrane beta-barrel domain-containing protein, partial [Planctomycetaceae bacterium]|nr:autotransporter outer membrane beta-barrel domain-containing protein [Planctomycetaceae bacterium]
MDDFSTSSLRTTLGTRISHEIDLLNGWAFTPTFRAAWLHEYLSTQYVKSASIAGAPGFATTGLDTGKDWVVLGTGIGFT